MVMLGLCGNTGQTELQTPHTVWGVRQVGGGFATGLEVVTLTCVDNKKILAALAPGMKSGGYM